MSKPYDSDEESPKTEDLRYEEDKFELIKGGQGRSSASVTLSAWFLVLLLCLGFWVIVYFVVIGVEE